jgi:hypothetical protein
LQLGPSLVPTSDDGGYPRIPSRQIFRGYRRGCAGAKRSNLRRVQDGERASVPGVGEHDDSLNGGEAKARPVFGEISVYLGREVWAVQIENSSFNVESAPSGVNSQHSGWRDFAFTMQSENLFDRCDALLETQQASNFPAGEQQRGF